MDDRIEQNAMHEKEPVNNLRALVVEDQPVLNRLMMMQLGLMNVGAEAAHNASEAREKFGKGEYANLLVTDFDLGGENGIELAASLREIKPDLIVALLSGRSIDDPDIQRFINKTGLKLDIHEQKNSDSKVIERIVEQAKGMLEERLKTIALQDKNF